MNEITRETINTDNYYSYYMKTINSTAEGYYYSCRFSGAGQYMLELQAPSVATDTGTAKCGTEDIC